MTSIDLWTADDVSAYLDSVGRPMTARSWRSACSRGWGLTPDARAGRTPLWTPARVKQWHEGRPIVHRDKEETT